MKFFMKLSATVLLVLAGISAVAYFFWYKPKFNNKLTKPPFSINKNEAGKIVLARLKQHASAIFKYNSKHQYNKRYCFMVDMKIEPGKKRFFVYNVEKDSVELAGLVTHGSGKTNTGAIQFSNTPNSLCSSVGKYKIGNAYNGKFGLAYKLYGLDKTNSNAYNRFVVLHSHACVPNEEVDPLIICESWGCPTVALLFYWS